MTADWAALVLGFLQAFVASAAFLLVLFIGFCVVFAYPKFRHRQNALVVRSLDERMNGTFELLGPNTPRGLVDQLKGAEPREGESRRSS